MPYRLPVLTSWAGPPYLIVSLATPDGARQSGRSLNPPRELPDRNRDRHCGSGRSTSARNRCFDRFVLSCRWEDASRREPCARLGAVETSSKKRTIPFPLSYDGTITLAHDSFKLIAGRTTLDLRCPRYARRSCARALQSSSPTAKVSTSASVGGLPRVRCR